MVPREGVRWNPAETRPHRRVITALLSPWLWESQLEPLTTVTRKAAEFRYLLSHDDSTGDNDDEIPL